MSIFKQKTVRPSFSPSHFSNLPVSPTAHYRSPSNSNSRIKVTQNRYGKPHISETSHFHQKDPSQLPRKSFHQDSLRETLKEAKFAETAPNFHTNPINMFQYQIPQRSVISHKISKPSPDSRNYYDPTNQLIDEKINYFINRNHQMSQQIQRLKQSFDKQNKDHYKSENGMKKNLGNFQAVSQQLKNIKSEAHQLFQNYQQKLNVGSRASRQMPSQEYISKALVEEILNIHEYCLRDQKTLKNQYKEMATVLEQLDRKSKKQRVQAQQNIKQLLEDIDKLKKNIKQTELQKNQALQLKAQFENLYNQKKKDYEVINNIQQNSKPNNWNHAKQFYADKINELERMSKEKERLIQDIRQENHRLCQRISQHPEGKSVEKGDIEEIVELQEKYCELEGKYEKEINIRLNIQGKLSLTAIENEKLRKEIGQYQKIKSEHPNNVGIEQFERLKHEIRHKDQIISDLNQKLITLEQNGFISHPSPNSQIIRNKMMDIWESFISLDKGQTYNKNQLNNHIVTTFNDILHLLGCDKIGTQRETHHHEIAILKSQIKKVEQRYNYITELLRSTLLQIDTLLQQSVKNNEQYLRNCIPKIHKDINKSLEILQKN